MKEVDSADNLRRTLRLLPAVAQVRAPAEQERLLLLTALQPAAKRRMPPAGHFYLALRRSQTAA
jgi:hypothetical protein